MQNNYNRLPQQQPPYPSNKETTSKTQEQISNTAKNVWFALCKNTTLAGKLGGVTKALMFGALNFTKNNPLIVLDTTLNKNGYGRAIWNTTVNVTGKILQLPGIVVSTAGGLVFKKKEPLILSQDRDLTNVYIAQSIAMLNNIYLQYPIARLGTNVGLGFLLLQLLQRVLLLVFIFPKFLKSFKNYSNLYNRLEEASLSQQVTKDVVRAFELLKRE